MGRAVASMKLIESKRAREIMYKKRGTSLKKKAEELATLCGVDLCMIMVPAEGDSSATVTWPADDPEKMHAVIESYRAVRASNDQRRCKNTTVSDCIQGWIKTKKEEIAKIRKVRYPTSGEIYQNLPEETRRELAGFLDAKIEALRQRMYDISMSKASTAANFANNSMDLLPLMNDNHVIQNQLPPVYQNTMYYDNAAMSDQFHQSVTYATTTSTTFQPQYVVQPLYGSVDGGAGWGFNYPEMAPQAEQQWVDDQYRSAGTSSVSDHFQAQFQVGKMESPYLHME